MNSNTASAAFHPPGGPSTMFRALARHKAMLGVPVLLALALGWFVASHLPRRYTAEAVLALDARKVQIASSEVVSHLSPDNAALRTELDIIASRSIAERVVDQLKLASDRGTLIEVAAEQAAGGILARLAHDFGADDLWRAALRRIGLPAGVQPTPIPHQSDVVDWVQGHLKVSNDGRSFTMFVAFTSEHPTRAARIANAVARGYLDEQVSRKEDMTRRASNRLAEKLGEMREAASAADAAVMQFRRASGLTETKGMTVVGQQLSELTTQLALARAERARTEGKLQMARTSNGNSLPDVLASQTIQDLRTQLSRAEVKIRENERNLFLLPDLRVTADSFRRQLEAETARIIASLSNEASAARAREASLSASIERLQTDYEHASSSMVQLNQLQREADANRTIYETFLARFKQTIEHEGLAVADALLITEAQGNSGPVFPKTLPILLIAGLSGTLLGGLGVVARERFDNRVRDIRHLDRIVGLPVLGVLPGLGRFGSLRRRNRLAGQTGARLAVALQWLRMALLKSQAPRRVQVILVTSAMPADGKTSLCVSLARELGRRGERVLVIDGDAYQPRVAAAFGAAGRRSPRLAPEACASIQDVVHTDPLSGAHFIGAPRPRDFQHMLHDGTFARLLAAAREEYDTVLLDTAPAMAGADAAVLGQLADMRLFVVRCGWTAWDQMLSALASLRLCGSAADGIVVVNADRRDLYQPGDYQPAWDAPGHLMVEHGQARAA